MTELEQRPRLPNPVTGELVELDDPIAVAHALADVARLRNLLYEFSDVLQRVLVEESQRQGTKTIRLGEYVAKVSGGGPTFPNIDQLLDALREAGLPDDRLEALIRVKREVNMRVLTQVWGASEAYADVIARVQGPLERMRVTVSPA